MLVRSLFATFLSCVSVVSHIYFSLSNNFHLLEKTPAQQLTVVSKMVVVVCPRLNTTSPIGWHTEHSAPIGGAVNMKLRNLPRTTNSCNNFSANNNVLGVSNTSHHMRHYTTRHVSNLFLFDAGYKICVSRAMRHFGSSFMPVECVYATQIVKIKSNFKELAL